MSKNSNQVSKYIKVEIEITRETYELMEEYAKEMDLEVESYISTKVEEVGY